MKKVNSFREAIAIVSTSFEGKGLQSELIETLGGGEDGGKWYDKLCSIGVVTAGVNGDNRRTWRITDTGRKEYEIFSSGPSETSKRIQRVNKFWRNREF